MSSSVLKKPQGKKMAINLMALLCGFIFALGLGISGMTLQRKVLGFLDLFGAWDPSLMFVMGGAVGVHILAYHLIRRRKTPLLETEFHVPDNKAIDKSLIIGSALFGIGWGLGGFCPGPALASVFSANFDVILFVAMMIIGMLLNRIPIVQKLK